MCRILIADGNEVFRFMAQHYFLTQGQEIEVAADGLECMAKMVTFEPDVVILDLKMPWGGAEGVLAEMRDTPGLAQIPVVLTSAPPFHEDQAELIVAPVVYALPKPISLMLLFASARAAMTNNRLLVGNGFKEFDTSENYVG